MRGLHPVKLADSMTKSDLYFRHARWKGRRVCPRCEYRFLLRIDGRYSCRRCKYKFNEFTGTYLGKLRIPTNVVAYLLHLFALGVPAYRIRFYVDLNLGTVEHAFRIFRESVYDSALDELKRLNLSGRLEMDEALFGGHRKGKRGWGAEGKAMVFGIYRRNGKLRRFQYLTESIPH